jgi:FGGY-family pentulose kinase
MTTCKVSAGIIDAHAGGLGLLGITWQHENGQPLEKLESALALICGTSNCHMAVSREPLFINGVWGPYRDAMIPGMWLNEGGQSTAGSAIDHIITSHANAPALFSQAEQENKTVYELLNQEVAKLGEGPEITRDYHLLPYFLGNRSPHADPGARAIIEGMTLDQSITSQALQYYACIQAVAYGTRDIIDAMNNAGYNITQLLATGGGAKNPLWLQEHADATGCALVLPEEPESVLLGSAITAAAACGIYDSLYQAMAAMSRVGKTIEPRRETRAYHDAKFSIFRELYQQQQSRRKLMAGF